MTRYHLQIPVCNCLGKDACRRNNRRKETWNGYPFKTPGRQSRQNNTGKSIKRQILQKSGDTETGYC